MVDDRLNFKIKKRLISFQDDTSQILTKSD